MFRIVPGVHIWGLFGLGFGRLGGARFWSLEMPDFDRFVSVYMWPMCEGLALVRCCLFFFFTLGFILGFILNFWAVLLKLKGIFFS